MLTAAAAANAKKRMGKTDTNTTPPMVPERWRAVAAAQNANRAEVKGRIAEFCAHW